ncbi:tetratricopeptide repeat protein, partial [bacterium]
AVYEIYPLLAEARLGAGDLNGARGAFQSALLRLPVAKTPAEKQQIGQIEANLRFSLGRVLGQLKKPKEALVEFRRTAALVPGDAETQSLIAVAAEQTGDHQGAIAAAKKALELNPKRSGDRILLARLYGQSKNWKAANEQYETYNRQQPKDGTTLIEWAFAARRAKQTEDELKVWAKLVALDPKNPFPLMQSGTTLRDKKRLPEALAKYEKALSLSTVDPAIMYEVASLQTQLRRHADATETWKRLVAAKPDYLPAYGFLLSASDRSNTESSTRAFLAKRLAQNEDPKVLSEILSYFENNKKNGEAKALLADVLKRNPKARAAKAALDSYEPSAPEPAEAKPTAEVEPTKSP